MTPSKFCPSLEIMKISYYHKKKGDIVEIDNLEELVAIDNDYRRYVEKK